MKTKSTTDAPGGLRGADCSQIFFEIMHDIENERNLVKAMKQAHKSIMTPQRELIDNLQEWGEEFREKQHGATLTILRARKTILDQSAKIHGLEELVTAFCEGQKWADESWKNQKHIKPLFDYANRHF